MFESLAVKHILFCIYFSKYYIFYIVSPDNINIFGIENSTCYNYTPRLDIVSSAVMQRVVVIVDSTTYYEGHLLKNISIILDINEGIHQIIIAVNDSKGFVHRYSYSICTDYTPPIIIINGTNTSEISVNNSVAILNIIAQDNMGIDRIEVTINNETYTYNSNNLTLRINVNATIIIRAYDIAGNVNTTKIEVYLYPQTSKDQTEHQTDEFSPKTGAMIGMGIVFLVLLAVVVVLAKSFMKRRKFAMP